MNSLRRAVRIALLAAVAAGCSGTTEPAYHFTNILFLGNSLTLHGPSADLGWSGNWGMAASDSEKDYAHVLSAKFPGARHRQANLGDFETNYRAFNLGSVDSLLSQKPDLVVVELGDNVADASEFQRYYGALLDTIQSKSTAQLVCTTTWFGKASIDVAIFDACSRPGARIVELSTVYADPLNRAASERSFINDGVALHPGDRGMAAIAAALYGALPQK